MRWRRMVTAFAALALLTATPVAAGDYHRDLPVVNNALEKNPSQVPQDAIDACTPMRDMAVKLYKMGKKPRAERRLENCMKLLKVGRYR